MIPRAKGTPEGNVRAVGANVNLVIVRPTDMVEFNGRGEALFKIVREGESDFSPSTMKSRSCPDVNLNHLGRTLSRDEY